MERSIQVDEAAQTPLSPVTVEATRVAESSPGRLVLPGSIDGDGAEQDEEQCERIRDAVDERPAAGGHDRNPAQKDERPACPAVRTDQPSDSDQRGHSTQDTHPE